LRDYIYIPLGGNRHGDFSVYRNLFLTFLIGGLWHGASWMFVIWGALHGFALILNRLWQAYGKKLNKYLAWFLTFNFANIAWVFFRADEVNTAANILSSMFKIPALDVQILKSAVIDVTQGGALVWIFLSLVLVLKTENTSCFFQKERQPGLKWFVFGSLILGISLWAMLQSTQSDFLYFDF
jgi:alginate O-acetyltransferase complex protein AlgI